jgi:hypothetical protein
MTEQAIITWLKNNVGAAIQQAITDTGEQLISADTLVGMAMRETGLKVMNLLGAGHTAPGLFTLIQGDWGKRATDARERYHGYGLWQIDVASYPDFVNSGDWKDPYKCCVKAIEVLNEKKKYLLERFPGLDSNPENFLMEIVAAYNCGQGAEAMAIHLQKDVDARTFNNDYANEVFRFSGIFAQMT